VTFVYFDEAEAFDCSGPEGAQDEHVQNCLRVISIMQICKFFSGAIR
jgi:hypothetical protein